MHFALQFVFTVSHATFHQAREKASNPSTAGHFYFQRGNIMTTHPMTARQARRAAEREARKSQNKQPQPPVAAATPIPVEPPVPPAPTETPTPAAEHEPPTTISEAQLAANRANAQHSTGPTTEAGKEKVSQNRITHGLSGTFRLLGWEDPEQFQDLAKSLYNEHQPATDSERRLVDSMTRSVSNR
jgi:hypothetical protein